MPKKQSNDLKDYNHIDLLYPGKYVKAAEFKGRDVTVTIESIEPRHELSRTDGTNEHKPILRLKGKQKAMVLNKTNAQTIASMYGPEAMEWIGKRITLYSAKVRAFGKMHDAIRIRDEAPAAKDRSIPDTPEPTHDPDTGEIAVDFDSIASALKDAADDEAATGVWSENIRSILAFTRQEQADLTAIYESKGGA